MEASLFLKIFIWQLIVIIIIVFVLKRVLDRRLIDSAIREIEILKRQQEDLSVQQMDVTSYKNLNSRNKERLIKLAMARFGGDVKLNFQIDKTMLGGIVIKLDEHVIEFSLKDRLRQAFAQR